MENMQKPPCPKKTFFNGKKEKGIGDKVGGTKGESKVGESKFLKLENDKNEQTVSGALSLDCLGELR